MLLPPKISRVLCPGSFDPPTYGHLDVIARAAAVFDEVVVAVVVNPEKQSRFSARDRVELLTQALADAGLDTERITVISFAGLLVDLCAERRITLVCKGLRGMVDADAEVVMATWNRDLSGVETVMFPADPRWQHVSSSMVVQIAALGGDISSWVPTVVADALNVTSSPR